MNQFKIHPEIRGDIYRSKGTTVQCLKKQNGDEFLIITSDSPRQYIEVPISSVNAGTEDLWARVGSERKK